MWTTNTDFLRHVFLSDLFTQVNDTVWYDMCMNYHCQAATPEDKEAIKCQFIEAYAAELKEKDIIVLWRTKDICRKYWITLQSSIYTS